MTFFRFLAVSLLTSTCFLATAQKVKYKDIYVWLANKQYDEAEPFLKRYLKENDDNPNAVLYMGLIYEHKSLKNDILKEGNRSIANMDSASLTLDKALKLITEKELRKNDEYYETFKRRDLRTGEYGVKISDIQFFIEKRLQELRERKDKIKLVNFYFALTDSTYSRSQRHYHALQQQYGNKKSMLLRSDNATLDQLSKLNTSFDSCLKAFDIFKTNVQALGKSNYNYQLTLNEITDLSNDVNNKVDFLNDQLQLWNFKKFAEESEKVIRDEITPLKDHLISADIDINKLREKLLRDSVSVRVEMEKLSTKLFHQKLTAYDDKPLPTLLFNLKIAEINYRSDLAAHLLLKDSANIPLKLTLAKQEWNAVKVLDSLAKALPVTLIDEKAADYEYFIKNTYNQASVLKSYVRGLQEFAEREMALKDFEVKFRTEGINWLIVESGDSVSLQLNPGLEKRYQPLVILPEKYTAGLHFKDSLAISGYLYAITLSRKPDLAIKFPVDVGYKHKTLAQSKAFIVHDAGEQIFFVILYNENKVKDKISVTVAKIYRSDGLAWSNHFKVDMPPASATFINGELIITGLDDKKWVLDKNGKMK
jgi:hypothetical protein